MSPPAAARSRSQIFEDLVHETGRLRATGFADDLCGHAGDGLLRRHRLEHHRAGGNAGAAADLDVAEDFRPGTDHHPAADFRMAVAVLLAGAPEGDAVEHGNIVLDDGGLADDEAGRVIEEDAPPDPGGGMNVGLERRGGAALEIIGEVLAVALPQPMRQPVGLDRVKAFEIQHRLGAGDGLRLVADAFPYRVYGIELEPCLMLRHDASGRLDLRVCSTGKGRHSPPPASSPKAAFPGPQARGFDANVEVFPRTR